MVHPGGRPRTVSLPPEEMIELGKEMIEWVKENNPIHLSQWYSIHKMYTDKQWDAMQQVPEFLPYYEMALKLVGINYITKGSDVEPSIKQRWLRVYYKDLKKQEDQDAAEETERKRSIASAAPTTYNIVVPHGLASGTNIPAEKIPNPSDNSAE